MTAAHPVARAASRTGHLSGREMCRRRPTGLNSAAADIESSVNLSEEQRIAEIEAIFRDSNRQLEERYRELGIFDSVVPFLCECGNPRCTSVVTLSRGEYEEVRAHPAYLLILPGHQLLVSERIAWQGDGFTVVELGSLMLRLVREAEASLLD
jgi:hypothetical protein